LNAAGVRTGKVDLKITDAQAVVTVGPLPRIMADQVLLAQVFQNLIANGIKFRSERVPRVHISAELVEGHYRFRIEDNGIGIPPESLEKIFEKRTRVWNPVEGLKVRSENVDVEALNQRAPQLAVAIGLAAAC